MLSGPLFCFFYLFSTTTVVTGWRVIFPHSEDICEPIRVPLCQSNVTKYSITRLPNIMGDSDQSRIVAFTKQQELVDLMHTNCSQHLVFFLCATLVPICVNTTSLNGADNRQSSLPVVVPPCRNLCQTVYDNCSAAMKRLNFTWPVHLNCSGLPKHASDICLDPQHIMPVKRNVKLRATCDRRSRNKDVLNARNLFNYDYVFRAKFLTTNGRRTYKKLSVQQFFKPRHMNVGGSGKRVSISARRCGRWKHGWKTMLFGASKVRRRTAAPGYLNMRIVSVIDWQNVYGNVIRGHLRNMRRRGARG